MQLRSHQAELANKLRKIGPQDLPLDILAYVVPGGGKSWLPGIVSRRFPEMKIAWFVPRLTLRDQAASGSLKDFNLPLWESENEPNPSRDQRGFVATHQALTTDPTLYEKELKRHPYILVTDEIHHAKLGRKGEVNQLASALSKLAPLVPIHLKMTGTLDTNDGTFIWGMEYDQTRSGYVIVPERSAKIYIRYDRKTALSEGAIVPIEFYHHDGPVSYINKTGRKEQILSLASNRREESEVIFTALRTEIADELLRRGIEHWKKNGQKLAIICDTQYSAKRIYKQLSRESLGDIALAITDEKAAAKEVKRYKGNSCHIGISCAMIYEGHDNPPITHIICLTNIRSIPWIEQMLARAWRAMTGKTKCWAFVPDDPPMNRVIEAIRIEQPGIIGFEGEGPGPPRPGEDEDDEARIVAIRSAIESIRSEWLDGDHAEETVRTKAIEMFATLGIPSDHPLIEQIVRASLAFSPILLTPASDLTPSEEAKHLRKGMHGACCGKDARDGVEFGTTQKELAFRTGIKFETATLEELRRAAIVCAHLCA